MLVNKDIIATQLTDINLLVEAKIKQPIKMLDNYQIK